MLASRWFYGAVVVSLSLWALFFAGIAQAQVVEGTSGGDVLNGTANGDKLYGYGGADTLNAKGGSDLLVGGSGADTLDAGCGYDNPQGNGNEDLIYVVCADGKPDFVECGSDIDIVFYRVPGTTFTGCEHRFDVTNAADREAGQYALYEWLARFYHSNISDYFEGP